LNAITLPRALKTLLPFPAGMTFSPVKAERTAEDLTGWGGCRVAFVAMVILVTGHHLDCDDVTAGPGISGHTRL